MKYKIEIKKFNQYIRREWTSYDGYYRLDNNISGNDI